jgi:DNA-binding LacI/PurR family transcriptional regulator
MATVEDLARASGYSRSTVFRYLAGKPVRPPAREAIAAAAREIGFGAAAPADRDDVALLFSAPAGFEGFRGFADAAEGIIRRAGELGLPLFFDENRASGKRLAAILLGKDKAEEDAEFDRRLRLGQRVVFVNRMIDSPDASWASADFGAAVLEGCRRLAAGGCRRIAFWSDAGRRRADAAKLSGILEYGRSQDRLADTLVLGPADGDVEEAARKILSAPGRPDGWMAISDEVAMRVIRVAATLALRVPEDLSVLGMNDAEGAAYFSPPLSSVRIPFRECGRAAVDAALRLFDNPWERSVRVLLRHRLVERESCAPIPASSL